MSKGKKPLRNILQLWRKKVVTSSPDFPFTALVLLPEEMLLSKPLAEVTMQIQC
jgi:hypothetical protein